MKMRIGAKLMLAAALGVLTVVAVTSFAAYHIAREGLQEEITAHLASVAQSRAAHVDTFLDEHGEYVWLAARSRELFSMSVPVLDGEGGVLLGVHAHLPEMGWGLLAAIDAEEAFAPIARLRSTILALGGLFAAASLALAYLLARRISRPIHRLHVGSERTAHLAREIAERKQAEMARERAMSRQVLLNRIQRDLLVPAALREKLKRITDGVVEAFEADFCRIWISAQGDLCEAGCVHARVAEGPHVCRRRDRCLHLMASSGRYAHIDGEVHRRVPFGCCKIGRVAADQDSRFLTNDVVHDPRVHNHEWAGELGLVSFAGYQLRPPGGQTIAAVIERWAKPRDGRRAPAPPRAPRPSPQPQAPPIDLARVRKAAGGDEQFVRDLAQLFCDDTEKRLARVREILDAEDAQALQREAHTAKGSSANCGAARMSEIATKLESLGREGNLKEARAVLATLEAEFERVRAYLSQELLSG